MGMTNGVNQPKRSGKRMRYQPMAEINVTPMVDVMLVLLIVFMVAAPLLSVGVPVNLPKAGAQSLQGDEEPLAISINAAGQIFIEENQIALSDLVPRLKGIVGSGYDQRIYVRGDKDVSYGRVAAVVARINAAGFARVALVTDNKAETGGAQ
jgi:biopolymer transport protein TolR